MLTFFQKNRFHVIVWAGMALYLILAPNLYSSFFLRNGKPIRVNAELPAMSKKIQLHVDTFKPTIYDGQSLYSMVGWAFSTADRAKNPEDYERQMVLISDKTNYIFSIETSPRADVQRAYKSLGMDLTKSGFTSLISQDLIKTGIYQIGVIFNDPQKGTSFYAVTDKYLIRTPNQIQISRTPTLSPTPTPSPDSN